MKVSPARLREIRKNQPRQTKEEAYEQMRKAAEVSKRAKPLPHKKEELHPSEKLSITLYRNDKSEVIHSTGQNLISDLTIVFSNISDITEIWVFDHFNYVLFYWHHSHPINLEDMRQNNLINLMKDFGD